MCTGAWSKAGTLTAPSVLRDEVIAPLEDRHSPRQIAVRLRADYPDGRTMWVSHETIYQAIYLQARGGLRKELTRRQALRPGGSTGGPGPRRRVRCGRGGPGSA
jgi:transposase, IS30 family